MNNILFHTFTTEGYIAWAELYLESLRYLYGDSVNIRMDTLNLKENQVELLNKIHCGLDLRNHRIDNSEAAKEIGISTEKFESWKKEIESGKVNNENYLFKIFISVNQRYRNMESIIKEAQTNGYKYLIHSDVDIYFRKHPGGLIQILDNHDFGAYFRDRAKSKQKILGAFLIFNLQNNVDKFLSEWMRQIDLVPTKERWRDFGQSALWYAVENTKDVIRIADLSTHNRAPIYSQMFDKKADFWLSTNSISSGMKIPMHKGWKDFKEGLPRLRSENDNNLMNKFFIKLSFGFDFVYRVIRIVKRKLQQRW